MGREALGHHIPSHPQAGSTGTLANLITLSPPFVHSIQYPHQFTLATYVEVGQELDAFIERYPDAAWAS